MSQPGRVAFCVAFGVANAVGLAVTDRPLPWWIRLGLLGFVPGFLLTGGFAKVMLMRTAQGKASGGGSLAVILIVVALSAFWLYCLTYATTGSWMWATVVAVAAGYLTLSHFSFRAAERRHERTDSCVLSPTD